MCQLLLSGINRSSADFVIEENTDYFLVGPFLVSKLVRLWNLG